MIYVTPLKAPMYARISTSYKYGNIFREVIKVPEFEICQVLKNLNLMPPFFKAMFDVFGESIKPVLKGCPYTGYLNLTIFADFNRFPSILPSGMYRFDGWFGYRDTGVASFKIQTEIVSKIKTSF